MFLIIWLLALVGPRVAPVFTWLFTSWVDRAYDGILFRSSASSCCPGRRWPTCCCGGPTGSACSGG